MKIAVLASALALAWATSAAAADRMGETCSGTETVQVGTQPPKTEPYALTFSADLTTKSYCYDTCGPDQTYAISDAASDPIRLADFDADDGQEGSQTRLIEFDRRSGTLTDDQSMNLGFLGKVVRHATARCSASTFHQPAPLPKIGKR
jgi:hypothetical protein